MAGPCGASAPPHRALKHRRRAQLRPAEPRCYRQIIRTHRQQFRAQYLQYLKTAKRKDASTVLKAAEGILRFEASTGYTSFKRFRIEQAVKYNERLNGEVSKTTGKPLSKSSIRSILAANKGFIF